MKEYAVDRYIAIPKSAITEDKLNYGLPNRMIGPVVEHAIKEMLEQTGNPNLKIGVLVKADEKFGSDCYIVSVRGIETEDRSRDDEPKKNENEGGEIDD